MDTMLDRYMVEWTDGWMDTMPDGYMVEWMNDGWMDGGMDRGMEGISILEPPECSACGCGPCSVSELGFQDELTEACSFMSPFSKSDTQTPVRSLYFA